jgi:hypothetical protein
VLKCVPLDGTSAGEDTLMGKAAPETQGRLPPLIPSRTKLRSGENLGLHRVDTFAGREGSADFR